MKSGTNRKKGTRDLIRSLTLTLLFLSCMMVAALSVRAGDTEDIPPNFLSTLQLLDKRRDEFIDAILMLMSRRRDQSVLMDSMRYYRMIVMSPRHNSVSEPGSTAKKSRFERHLLSPPRRSSSSGSPSPSHQQGLLSKLPPASPDQMVPTLSSFVSESGLPIRPYVPVTGTPHQRKHHSISSVSEDLSLDLSNMALLSPFPDPGQLSDRSGEGSDSVVDGDVFDMPIDLADSASSVKRESALGMVQREYPANADQQTGSNLSFFIERDYVEEDETDSAGWEPVNSPPAYDYSESVSGSPIGRSPAHLSGMDTSELYVELIERNHARNKRRRTSQAVNDDVESASASPSGSGWYIQSGPGAKVFDCKMIDLFNPAKFGKAFRKHAHRCRFYRSLPLPPDREADFFEVFVRVIDDTSIRNDRAYIHDDLLCIVTSLGETELPMTFEFCARFQRYDQYSLAGLARNEYISVASAGEADQAFDENVDRFLREFEKVAQFEMVSECEQQLVKVPSYEKPVLIRCIGRGQCKAVFEIPELFPGLAFSWQRGHTQDSARLLEGLQAASLTVYEELARGRDPKTQELLDTDQIQKPSHKSLQSTRMPSAYRLVPAGDGSTTVVEIQHRIKPQQLAQSYIIAALKHGLNHVAGIPVKYREVIPTIVDFNGTQVEDSYTSYRTEIMHYPLIHILEAIFETLIDQLVRFTSTLGEFRTLRNIPVSIGVDSKLPNYYVSFYLGIDGTLKADLKNFDNEPPNLKLLHNGEPLYRGGPLFDRITEVFPESRLQENFVDRVQKITAFRSLLKKLLASIAADFIKYHNAATFDFQWVIDRINLEAQSQEVGEKPVSWAEIDEYMKNSQKSHRAFRLYVWACQLVVKLQPGRANMPQAFIPVDHDQKAWLLAVQQNYEYAIVGLILQNRLKELDELLQLILSEDIDFPSEAPLPLSASSWLRQYMARFYSLQLRFGTEFSHYMNQLQDHKPVVPALDALVDDFLYSTEESLKQDLKQGYGAYCLKARVPVINQMEHTYFHSWWDAWRQVRLQCGTASQHRSGTNAQQHSFVGQTRLPTVFTTLTTAWRGTLKVGRFDSPQQALAQLYSISRDRIRALLHRLLFTIQGEGVEPATQWLFDLQEWFDARLLSKGDNYKLLALFAGLLLKREIHVFEFDESRFVGVTVLGMGYDAYQDWVPRERFIPYERVNLSHYAPGQRPENHILFHNVQRTKTGGHGHRQSWFSVGVPLPAPQTDPDLDELLNPGLLHDVQTPVSQAELNQPTGHNPEWLQQYIKNWETLFFAASFRVIRTPRDNVCLYHAIAEVLSRKLHRSVNADEVKKKIRQFLARLRHKFQCNLGAINNQDDRVIEPYTNEELYLLNTLGGMLDVLDAEINVEGLWNDYTMIIIAANAFQTPLHFVVPAMTPVMTEAHAEVNVVQVNPARENQMIETMPYEPVVFYTGEAHWEAAEPADEQGRSLLEWAFAQFSRTQNLAAILAFLQCRKVGSANK